MDATRNRLALRLLDLGVYALAVTLGAVAALVPLSLLAGAGLAGIKLGLFVIGVLAFGYATLLLRPSRPARGTIGAEDDPGEELVGVAGAAEVGDGPGDPDPREDTRVESLVGRIPPLDRYEIPPVDRFHPGTKLYAASLLMLGVSYVMEAVLGVGG